MYFLKEYAQKQGNYTATVDDTLTFQFQALVIDDPISVNGLSMIFRASVDVN